MHINNIKLLLILAIVPLSTQALFWKAGPKYSFYNENPILRTEEYKEFIQCMQIIKLVSKLTNVEIKVKEHYKLNAESCYTQKGFFIEYEFGFPRNLWTRWGNKWLLHYYFFDRKEIYKKVLTELGCQVVLEKTRSEWDTVRGPIYKITKIGNYPVVAALPDQSYLDSSTNKFTLFKRYRNEDSTERDRGKYVDRWKKLMHAYAEQEIINS